MSFKDHCPGSRARSAHTPMQRTQTVQAGGGLGDPSSSPCLFSRGKETWMGSSWPGMGEKQGPERVCAAGREVGAMQQGEHSESERPRVTFWPGDTGHGRAIQLRRLAPCHSRVHPFHYSHSVIGILRQFSALRKGHLSHLYKDASSLLFVIYLFLHFFFFFF